MIKGRPEGGRERSSPRNRETPKKKKLFTGIGKKCRVHVQVRTCIALVTCHINCVFIHIFKYNSCSTPTIILVPLYMEMYMYMYYM